MKNQEIVALTDNERRIQLRSMRIFATSLLGGMAVLFVVGTLYESQMPWLGFVRAFSEAAMVGALADWFAVSALFRHPFGLPIPHTAIIPMNKDRIGESLGNFVEKNFLSVEIVSEKLRSTDIARIAGGWLAKQSNAEGLAERIVSAIPSILHAFDDEAIHRLIRETITERIKAIEVAPLAGTILNALTANNRHQGLLDEAIKLSVRLLEENKVAIREKIKEDSPWYIPGFVDNKIYEKILTTAETTLSAVSTNPHHELRTKFHRSVQEFIYRLRTSDEYRDKGEELKTALLEHPVLQQYFSSLWIDLKALILRDVYDPHSRIKNQIVKTVQQFGERLHDDEELRSTINRWIEEAVSNLIVSRKHDIADLISSTVRKWDAQTMTERIELYVGRDLQFIRINGTIVGGCIGVLIYLIAMLLRS